MMLGRCRRVAVLWTLLAALGAGPPAIAATFVVAPGGRDDGPATEQQPLATVEAARDRARRAGAGPHRITLLPGDYFLTKTLELDSRDNGLSIEAGPGARATLYGGVPVGGWRRDGDRFWCVDLPEVKQGKWDFRALIVGERMAERARLPETGEFTHRTEWKGARYISGAWDPQPTLAQRTTIDYNPQDVPASLDLKNAEIRVYHMWNEALYGIARIDREHHRFMLSSPTVHPPGAFGGQKYVLFNLREGMTRPGQWYLDRTAGRLVYWPLPGEDMARVKVVAPRLERIIQIVGTARQPAENIALCGLRLRATTTLLGARGYTFAGNGHEGAVYLQHNRGCRLERLEIDGVGGEGLLLRPRTEAVQILDCHIHHLGACGVEITSAGAASRIRGNHIHHVGLGYPCAAAMLAHCDNLHFLRNEIHDIPYCGVVCNGRDNRLEQNLFYRVMREMHDGAAIYGHMTRGTLRGNLVRDVVEQGRGFGASAYYLDEQSCDCVVERNVALGVPMPTHNHISRNLVYRDNLFITDQDMTVSFVRSGSCAFEGNTLLAGGKINILQPNAIKVWKDNLLMREGLAKNGAPQAFTIDNAMPPTPKPGRRAPIAVVRVAPAPVLDGEVGAEEWPGATLNLDREPSRLAAIGVPSAGEVGYDDRFLYVAVSAGFYDDKKLRTGTTWGQDDGAEIAIAGRLPDGRPTTFVIRAYPNGTVQSVTDAGAPADAAQRVGKAVRFATTTWRHGWRGEWAIPLAELGLKPTPDLKVPFNLSVYRAEDETWRCWEGTQAETWRLEQGGMLQLK
jgi:hypothetical protein